MISTYQILKAKISDDFLSEDQFRQRLEFEIWVKKNRGSAGRHVSTLEAMQIFKEDLYDLCINKIGYGEQEQHFKDLLWDLKKMSSNRLNVETARQVPIESIISRFGIEIKRDNWCVCCFHEDNNPSLKFYPRTNSYYCFVCGAGGDVINFVMRKQGCNFVEAVKYLSS